MSLDTPSTTRLPVRRVLALSLVATMFAAGCGSADDSTQPRKESVSEPERQLVRVHYSQPMDPDPEGEGGYGVEMDVIARGADQSRTELDLLVEGGRVDESVLIIRDGNRALLYGKGAEKPYTLMEAADENPDDLPWQSSPLELNSDLFQQVCPDAAPSATRTILGRNAVGYACTWDDPDEAAYGAGQIWLDKATSMLLEYGSMKATEFVVDPEIEKNAFSTKPPAGAGVHVIKATGKGPPQEPVEEELDPLDALATISETASHPIYYLTPEFEGVQLSEALIYDDVSGSDVPGDLSLDAGQSLWIFYGDHLQMNTTRFVPDHYRKAVGCSRLPPLRGVPTVEQAGAFSLFTGDLVIWLGVANPKQAAPAAAALMEVGNAPTAAALPAPSARNMALVDKACGSKPGDHGRRMPH